MQDPSLSEKLSSYYKRRHLLTKAYRASRQAGNSRAARKHGQSARHFLEAAEIVKQGETEGIKVGGINSYAQTQGRAKTQIAQEASNMKVIADFLASRNAKKAAPAAPVAKAPVAEAPDFSVSDMESGHTDYADEDWNKLFGEEEPALDDIMSVNGL